MAGWVKLHRALQNWEWWHDDKMLRVFLTILLNVNHDDGRWQGHEVKKGQWITGRKKLVEMTGVSDQSIRTILKRLESSQELTIKSTSKFSVITVVNWHTYQSTETESTSTLTNDQPTTNQQVTTNKNEKKVKKETKTSLPEKFLPSERVYNWAVDKNHNIIEDDIEGFCVHHSAKGNKFVDWDSAFMNWMRNKKKFNKESGDNGNSAESMGYKKL